MKSTPKKASERKSVNDVSMQQEKSELKLSPSKSTVEQVNQKHLKIAKLNVVQDKITASKTNV